MCSSLLLSFHIVYTFLIVLYFRGILILLANSNISVYIVYTISLCLFYIVSDVSIIGHIYEFISFLCYILKQSWTNMFHSVIVVYYWQKASGFSLLFQTWSQEQLSWKKIILNMLIQLFKLQLGYTCTGWSTPGLLSTYSQPINPVLLLQCDHYHLSCQFKSVSWAQINRA